METTANILWSAAILAVSVTCWFVGRAKGPAAEADHVPKADGSIANDHRFATDLCEWVWGHSNHQSPAVPGRSEAEATRLHEERIVDLVAARPGQKLLDVGCGTGGPMLAVARKSGSHVLGITIDDYQASRARAHVDKAGLASQCEVVCGDFRRMPFPDGSFDAAYSIESTLYAPRLEDVYGEVFRVLRPGGLYVSYEVVTTDLYDAGDADHVETVKAVGRLCGAPVGLRAHDELAGIARKVGFEVVVEKDLAKPPAGPWWARLKAVSVARRRNHLITHCATLLGIAPREVAEEIHDLMTNMAVYMSRAGEAGIYSPMHMILCKKPSPPLLGD